MSDYTTPYELLGNMPELKKEPWIQGPWIAKTVVNKQLSCHEWVIGPARQKEDLEWTMMKVAARVSTCCGPEMRHTAALVANAPYMFRLLLAVQMGYAVQAEIKEFTNAILSE